MIFCGIAVYKNLYLGGLEAGEGCLFVFMKSLALVIRVVMHVYKFVSVWLVGLGE